MRVIFHAEVRNNLDAFRDGLLAGTLALRDACGADGSFLADFRFDVGLWHEVLAIDVVVNIDRSFGRRLTRARFGWVIVLVHGSPL